ncbi:MAG: hypothetical protein M1832_002969 [Thelocarpon impressellum]|nr:MAG: hypothetical protein M1832_002969 [Thelocarpon impressellum]
MAEKAADGPTSAAPPIPHARLREIASDACNAALRGADSYDHTKTQGWNTTIINTILQSLIAEASHPPATAPAYKFAVNSTIIQHQAPPPAATTSTSTSTSTSTATTTATEADARADTQPMAGGASHERTPAVPVAKSASSGAGRRGMHSATGAYWNNERDGMWNYKFEGGDASGLDVVVSLIWIGV